MIGTIRLAVRLPLVVLCILCALLAMSLCYCLGLMRANRALMCAAFRAGAIITGVRIHTQSSLAKERPLLLVSNHFSYLDLFALGSVVPAAFTPKSEIAGWPVIGILCKMTGCVFIDRRSSQTLANKAVLEAAGKRGDVISIFPEGTTGEGHSILPFKSSYFSLAIESGLSVQPLSIVYTHLNGRPLEKTDLPLIGWYGDMYLLPHLLAYLRQKHTDVTLVFHPAVQGGAFTDRKVLTRYCYDEVVKPFFMLQPNVFKVE